jgi:hypothetical protein
MIFSGNNRFFGGLFSKNDHFFGGNNVPKGVQSCAPLGQIRRAAQPFQPFLLSGDQTSFLMYLHLM